MEFTWINKIFADEIIFIWVIQTACESKQIIFGIIEFCYNGDRFIYFGPCAGAMQGAIFFFQIVIYRCCWYNNVSQIFGI